MIKRPPANVNASTSTLQNDRFEPLTQFCTVTQGIRKAAAHEMPLLRFAASLFFFSAFASAQDGGSSAVGPVTGLVVGCILAALIAVAVIVFYRRRRSRAAAAESAGVSASNPQPPLSDEGTAGPSSLSGSPIKMRLYVRVFEPRMRPLCHFLPFTSTQDPNDPSTFPGYQGDRHTQDIPPQVTMSSNIISGNTVSNTQTSLPHEGRARGYHGLPIV